MQKQGSLCRLFFNALLFTVLLLMIGATASAQSQNGYISARSFAEAQGIAYQWFPIQKLLVMRKGLKSVKLTVDNNIAVVDDIDVPMPAPAKIINGQIMVPATSIARFFQLSPTDQLNNTPPGVVQVAVTPAPKTAPQPVPPAVIVSNQSPTSQENEAVLVALRHSVREDHTRVVLEFSDQITYKSEFKDDLYRLSIMGCRNLIPTNRTRPEGRDIKKLEINSGPDRKGLILSFFLKQTEKQPTIETVASPFRMVISFAAPDSESQINNETPPQATSSEKIPSSTDSATKVEPEAITKKIEEVIPEINITVEQAQLNNPEFKGRVVVIDPGHGGTDNGFAIDGRPDEKTISLSVSQHLKSSLEARGLRGVLIRDSDKNMSQSQRISMANKNGGDLFISIHVGGSFDTSKSGFAVYTYSKNGTHIDASAQGLNFDTVYTEWLKSTRFDLADFFSKKVLSRLTQHMKSENRGIQSIPLPQLRFLVNPAIMVEVGMLSDQTEGKKLASDNYRKALGQSVANAVVDFFNGIVINP